MRSASAALRRASTRALSAAVSDGGGAANLVSSTKSPDSAFDWSLSRWNVRESGKPHSKDPAGFPSASVTGTIERRLTLRTLVSSPDCVFLSLFALTTISRELTSSPARSGLARRREVLSSGDWNAPIWAVYREFSTL